MPLEYTPLLARAGDARLVLLCKASHGTQEFYRVRAAKRLAGQFDAELPETYPFGV